MAFCKNLNLLDVFLESINYAYDLTALSSAVYVGLLKKLTPRTIRTPNLKTQITVCTSDILYIL